MAEAHGVGETFWDRVPGNTPLREWAIELRAACAAGASGANGDDPWELTGRAAMLIGRETDCSAILRQVAAEAGMGLVNVAADEVLDLIPQTQFRVGAGDVTDPSPTEAWRQLSPVIVHLARGPWMREKAEGADDGALAASRLFRSCLARWIGEFDRAQPVLIVTSADEIPDMAESLREAGLFDRFLRPAPATLAAQGHDFIERVGPADCGASITDSPSKVGKLVRSIYEDERRAKLAVLRVRRLVAREKRKIEFIDLVRLSHNGFAEADALPAPAERFRRQTAYHEAGHTVAAVIESHGQDIPEYASITPTAEHNGVVVQSYAYGLDGGDCVTYGDMRERVRISLAGRAAEELVFGAECVSNGCTEDLKTATDLAGTAFAHWGFAPSMESEGRASSNLAIVDGDTISASQHAHVEVLVREFLAAEYGVVKEMLATNWSLLDAIAGRLMRDTVADQGVIVEMVREHVPALDAAGIQSETAFVAR
jgi:cell division protease FtsH